MSQNLKSYLGKMSPKIIGALLLGFIIVIGSGIALGFTIGASNQPTSTEPFHLDLVETMANKMNGVGDAMASYFLVTNQGLVHPTTITVPSHRLIELTITTYDMGNLTTNPIFLNVNGTVNNQMTIINGTMASMDDYSMSWANNVSSVPASEILHTFTIKDLNINIPVVAQTTEIAYLMINQAGTFQWQCYAPCGAGTSGWSDNMADAGWMSGTFIVT